MGIDFLSNLKLEICEVKTFKPGKKYSARKSGCSLSSYEGRCNNCTNSKLLNINKIIYNIHKYISIYSCQ